MDARDGPLNLCRRFQHSPDVYINVMNKDEKAVQLEIQEYMGKAGLDTDRSLGCDGEFVTSLRSSLYHLS